VRGLTCVACLLFGGCAALCDDYGAGPYAPFVRREAADARDIWAKPSWRRARTLLAPPGKPECDAEAAGKPPAAAGDGNAELALRIRLEYERECYRQAELRVRRQLKRLQAAIAEEAAAQRPRVKERRAEPATPVE
jgi:hypothetical protein